MEWLKKLLEKHGVGAELVTTIMDDTKDTNYVPQARFDEVNNSLKELKGQIADRDKQLKDLGEKAKGNEELTKQITELQEANKKAVGDYEAKIRNITLDNAIKLKLKENNAKYEDLLLTKFDREKIKIKDDGSLEGLDEQFTTVKEGYKDLFGASLSGNNANNNGGSAGQTSPLQAQYAEALKNGNMPLAVSIKNKMFEDQNKK